MKLDNFFDTAATNFGEAITAMKRAGTYDRDPVSVAMLLGLQRLAQGLRQNEQVMEAHLADLAKRLPPAK